MNRIIPLTILVLGVALLIMGLNAGDSLGSEVSEIVNGAPSNKSIWLITFGILGSVIGSAGLLFGRRSS